MNLLPSSAVVTAPRISNDVPIGTLKSFMRRKPLVLWTSMQTEAFGAPLGQSETFGNAADDAPLATPSVAAARPPATEGSDQA